MGFVPENQVRTGLSAGGGGFELPDPRGRPALNNTPDPMSAGIFAGVIATQEFALGLSQLGTDGSNPSPSSGESVQT